MRTATLLRAFLALSFISTAPAQSQIRIGQTAGFSGPVAAGVKEVTLGAKLYLDFINSKGGVHGQTIELVSLDDQFKPETAAENARQLIEKHGVLSLFLTRGTPHTQALVPLLAHYKIPLIGPSTGAMALHQPVSPHVFNVRATYQREAEKAIMHLTSLGMTRIALVYVDDSFGNDGVAGAQKGLESARLQPVLMEKLHRDTPDFSAIGPRVLQTQAQAVLMIASAAAVAEGVKAVRSVGSKAQVLTLSNNASGGFIKNLGEQAHGVIVSQVFPHSQNFPFVKEAVQMARAGGHPEVSPAMLEGFAAAKVLVEALRRTGAKPTRDRLQTTLERFEKYDLGGLEIAYTPTDHTGLDFSDLAIISGGKFRR